MSDQDINSSNPITNELIAPCGMNCAICSRYLAFKNNIKRSQCTGCRTQLSPCTYLFAKCTGINNTTQGKAVFCFECSQYPCKQIKRMEKRYKNIYKMSVIENLEFIREKGLNAFIEEQYRTYRCSRCGELISIHNKKCFKCDTITRLVDKNS
ncbi:MAG TPA: DUF3795 domain-containing protein [bacterium]|nr:DUF3795 domain-containing protein [bacterium]HPN45550.1 DUF3795 domain-containing protein [bacterium]